MTIEPGQDGLRLTKGARAMKDEADLRAENERLRAALSEARAELANWGWGDFHYGSQPQEQSVVNTIAKIDTALGQNMKVRRSPRQETPVTERTDP